MLPGKAAWRQPSFVKKSAVIRETGRLPLIKKCAILAMVSALDQLYAGKYDECCAMLRAVTPKCILFVNESSVSTGKTAQAAHQSVPVCTAQAHDLRRALNEAPVLVGRSG
ncbi:hypothetical protein [Pseudomonas sp. Irchel s3a18]|uniref:hypothetical protein n=1 Tax=Pseudomonas sp. Irchel s3a18 TaxID=2009053 RepID=UPI00117A3743|nr:hypothetical protein [Pseudomonas sp. Irchel s3a18]